MIFSGKKYLSICHQTGLSFNLGLTLDNVTGNCNFGFTGENKNLNFKLESGRVFDPENRLIYFYDKDETIQISGNISRSNYSYYINENLLCLNGKKNNFVISGYYINPSNCKADLNIDIFGTRPNYELYLNSDFYIEQGTYISGNIKNLNNINFQIYSGSISIPENFTINSLPSFVYDTGYFTIDHYVNTSNQIEMEKGYEIKLNLFTNFGEITKNFITTGSYQEKIYLNLSLTDITNYFTRTGAQNALGDFKDNEFYINFIYNSGIKSGGANLNKYLSIDLKYSGGVTGQITGNIFASGYKNLTLTGFLSGSGYLDGTGEFNATGYHALSGVQIVGNIIGSTTQFYYVTGYIPFNLGLLSTGDYLNHRFIDDKSYNFTGFSLTGIIDYNNYLTENFTHTTQEFQFSGHKITSNQSGTILLISDPYQINNGFSTGRLYVQSGNGASWSTQTNSINNPYYSGLKNDEFFGEPSINSIGNRIGIFSQFNSVGVNKILSGKLYILDSPQMNLINAGVITGFSGTTSDFARSKAFNTGNICVLGDTGYNLNSGAAFVYTSLNNNIQTWNLLKTLSGNHTGQAFSKEIKINDDGNILFIGAPDKNNSNHSGDAYIYTGDTNNWALLNKISRSNYSINDKFGQSITFNKNANILAIGAPNHNLKTGIVFIFTGNKNSQWKEVNSISGQDVSGFFGTKIEFDSSGELLAIGASGASLNSGVVYIYTGLNNTWSQSNKIIPTGNISSIGSEFKFIKMDDRNTIFISDYLNNRITAYSNIIFTGYLKSLIATGVISVNDNYYMTGLLTGQKYTKTFTGAFNVITGYVVNGIISGLTDFQINNKIVSDRYNSTGLINSGIDNLYIKIKTRNYFDNNNITGILTLSGYDIDKKTFSLITRYITGIK